MAILSENTLIAGKKPVLKDIISNQSVNLDDYTIDGIYKFDNLTMSINFPNEYDKNNLTYLQVLSSEENKTTQIIYNGYNIFIRYRSSSNTWTPWLDIYTTASDNVNADTLDNYHASSFYRQDYIATNFNNATAEGKYRITSSTNAPLNGCSDWICLVYHLSGGVNELYQIAMEECHYSNSSITNGTTSIYSHNSPMVFIRKRYNGTWYSWQLLWNSGNDGSGSGLDADKLDGKQASDFVPRIKSTTSINIDSVTNEGMYEYTSITSSKTIPSFSGSGSGYGLIVKSVKGHSHLNCCIQLMFRDGCYDIYERYYHNYDWSEWIRLNADSGGTGSGIDTDMVDGKHSNEISIPTVSGGMQTSPLIISNIYNFDGTTKYMYIDNGYFTPILNGEILTGPALVCVSNYTPESNGEIGLPIEQDRALMTVFSSSGIVTYYIYGDRSSNDLTVSKSRTRVNATHFDDKRPDDFVKSVKSTTSTNIDYITVDGMYEYTNITSSSTLPTFVGSGSAYGLIVKSVTGTSDYDCCFQILLKADCNYIYMRYFHNGSWSAWENLNSTSSQLLTKIKKVDGSGSGLDADLLNARPSYGYAKSGYASGTLPTTGGLTAISSCDSQMYRFYDSSNLIGEGSSVYYGVIQIYYTSSYYIRIAISMSSGKIYRQTSGTTAWNEVSTRIPVVSTDPSNPSEGQMWILNS